MSNLLNPIADILTSETTYLNGALFAAFLAFAATGEWVAERAGTINISIEAMLLNGAFAALLGYNYSGSIIIGLITAVLGAMLVAGIQAEMSHRLFADQFVVGLTLNILVLGLSGFLNNQISPRATLAGRWDVPLLSEIPLVGTALFAQRWPFYLLYPLIPFSWWLVH
ncbi:MAG: ABC transporter permease, partial [Acidimicrobiaceae bacterium]|nr:ABC transporter permease [Acidimicrobiaceae bacterium]